jgi:hypothetical protein
MTLALGGALAAAVVLALATSHAKQETRVSAEAPAPALASIAQVEAPSIAADAGVRGEVIETIAASKYTYLRLRAANGEMWAAVPSASIAVGSQVAIADATRMDDFKSATLKRTFKTIYFGTLAAPPPAAAPPKFAVGDVLALDDDPALPPGHPDIGSAAPLPAVNEADPMPAGHPDISASPSPSSVGRVPDAAQLPALHIDRAHGGGAYSIVELGAQRQKLAGQRVRVRGQVTKVTPDVQGRAFFHLRDGEAGATAPDTDLVITSNVAPERGQVATFEGTLRADIDVGIGFKYPVLLENATLIAE